MGEHMVRRRAEGGAILYAWKIFFTVLKGNKEGSMIDVLYIVGISEIRKRKSLAKKKKKAIKKGKERMVSPSSEYA